MAEPTLSPDLPRAKPAAVSTRRERRTAARAPVAFIRCFSPAPGTIFNVSRMGVGIETFRAFNPGENVFLTSELGGRPQRTYGTVRWCRQIATAGGSSSPVYQIGIELAEPMERRWLAALVELREH
jgi:hypothetical protein